jgi:SSS family solute:Na+ symporter
MNLGLVILAVYIAVLLGIALYASKKDKKNIKDFATGGGLGIFILTLTFSATYHSAYAFMGAGGFAYKNGIGWGQRTVDRSSGRSLLGLGAPFLVFG